MALNTSKCNHLTPLNFKGLSNLRWSIKKQDKTRLDQWVRTSTLPGISLPLTSLQTLTPDVYNNVHSLHIVIPTFCCDWSVTLDCILFCQSSSVFVLVLEGTCGWVWQIKPVCAFCRTVVKLYLRYFRQSVFGSINSHGCRKHYRCGRTTISNMYAWRKKFYDKQSARGLWGSAGSKMPIHAHFFVAGNFDP